MIEPLCVELDRDGFTKYVETELPDKMKLWRPRGVVLHNMGPPTLDKFYVDTFHQNKPMSGAQRVKNTWESYRRQKWNSGPHLFVTDKHVILANPLWIPGTHSPSWNQTFWGLEMPGDYDKEPFPDGLRDMVSFVMATLYSALGHVPTNDTFHLHKEDEKTAHKRCPGKNAGTKAQWLDRIKALMLTLNPHGCDHEGHTPSVS